jgi:cytochrome c2
MLSANFFWTGRNLYNFMANTRSVLPKTNCKLSTNPITSEADRADLISLFRQFTE